MITPAGHSSLTAVILDFDGPVCGMFAGLPAPQVADRLRTHLLAQGWDAEAELPASPDPLQVLIDVDRLDYNLSRSVEQELQRARLRHGFT